MRTEEMDVAASEDKKMSVGNRGSLYVRSDGKFSRSANQAQSKKLSSKFLNNLNIDKISEIKHIFHICEGNKGYATLDQIKDCKIVCLMSLNYSSF